MKFLLLTTVFLAMSCGDNRSVGTSDPVVEPVRGVGAQQNAVIPGSSDTNTAADATFDNTTTTPAAEDSNANLKASGVSNSDLNSSPNPAPIPNGSDTFRRESTIGGTQQTDPGLTNQAEEDLQAEEELNSESEVYNVDEEAAAERQEAEDLTPEEELSSDSELYDDEVDLQAEEEMNNSTDIEGPRHEMGIYGSGAEGEVQEEEAIDYEIDNSRNDPNGPDNNNNTIDR